MSPLYLFIFTQVASTKGFIVAVSIIFLVLMWQGRKQAASFFVSCAVGLMVSVGILKQLFHVARPVGALIEANGYSFPSGHATGAMFLALCVSYFASKLRKPWRYSVYVASIGAALLIGYSRIHLGVHTPLQVCIGFLLGMAWAVAYIRISLRLKNK